jgi:dextranase
MTQLLPTKATFAPDEPIVVEVRGSEEPVSLFRLEQLVAEAQPADGFARFAPQPEGGYGVEGGGATTALDVLADPFRRPRYGFVADYKQGREVAGVAENIRRLHLNCVQFYDWMYRHAQLLPPQDEFEDALGRSLSLETVRELAAAVREAGAAPIGYAAVYAAGREEWADWQEAGLFHRDGSPWTLGDFLWNTDPTNERWLAHFSGDLRGALDVGFAGFHLDQYGSPKLALRADRSSVDLAEGFPALLERLSEELPGTRLIFNNVNDFPTWATAQAPQDAVYIEVWAPHTRLAHLAELVTKARAYAPDKPVILAAYLSCYGGDEQAAAAAERLQHAVVYSHGGSVLLHGEEGHALVEAYYVSNKELSDESRESARRCYDFAVRYGDLLFGPRSVDVTRMMVGGENREIRIEAPVPVATDCEHGALWVRVIRTSLGLLLSLIDLSRQTDDLWDAPKRASPPLTGARVSIERSGTTAPSFHFAEPDDAPGMTRLEPTWKGRYDSVELPAFGPWSLLLIREGA